MAAWRRKTLGYICENWEPQRRTVFKRGVCDSKLFRKQTARILKYRTNVNGTVKWFFREYFETIGKFPLRDF